MNSSHVLVRICVAALALSTSLRGDDGILSHCHVHQSLGLSNCDRCKSKQFFLLNGVTCLVVPYEGPKELEMAVRVMKSEWSIGIMAG